jgi:hypothetical protein
MKKGFAQEVLGVSHPNRKFWSVLHRSVSKRAKERACWGSSPGLWVTSQRNKATQDRVPIIFDVTHARHRAPRDALVRCCITPRKRHKMLIKRRVAL